MANNGTTLLRPRYFDRQQLRADDLNLGQSYLRERLRRHNRHLHGWGVVCGLQVTLNPDDPYRAQIQPGYAVTPLGDEVEVAAPVTFDMTAGAALCLGEHLPCPHPEDIGSGEVNIIRANIDPPGKDVRTAYNEEWVELRANEDLNLGGWQVFHTIRAGTQSEEYRRYYTFPGGTTVVAGEIFRVHSGAVAQHADPEPGLRHFYVATGGQVGNWRLNNNQERIQLRTPEGRVVATVRFRGDVLAPQPGTIYLAICPHDETICPTPALPADCAPPGGTYEFSRVREGHAFAVLCDLPPSHGQPLPDCETLEAIICGQAHVPCPPAAGADDNCVVLATITYDREGEATIDDLADRRQLLSEALMLAYARCRCEEPPPPTRPTLPTLPTLPTFPTLPTLPTIPTLPTAPTFITTPTFITRPTLITQPTFITTPTFITQPTFITRPTFLTDPTFITRPTFFTEPTFITQPTFPSFFTGPGDIIFDANEFDLDRGAILPVSEITGIGPVREGLLRDAGIANVLAFATMPATDAAAVLGVSEVRVAEWQTNAMDAMRRTP